MKTCLSFLFISLAFLASAFVPQGVHANPKLLITGEYPEAVGARCTDVDYASQSIQENSTEDTTFVMRPNSDGPTMYISVFTSTE